MKDFTRVSDPKLMELDRSEQIELCAYNAREQLHYALENIPFWQGKDLEMPISSIETPDDIVEAVGGAVLKDHFRDGRFATMASKMYQKGEGKGRNRLALLTYSGGTSARNEGKLPTIHLYPQESWETQIRTMRRSINHLENIVAKDNYTNDHFGGLIFNATVNGYGEVPAIGKVLPRHPVLNDEQNVDLMRANQANILIATPSAEEGKAYQSLKDMLMNDSVQDPYITSENMHEVWFSSKAPEQELLEELVDRGLRARGFYGSAEAGMLARECYRSMDGKTDNVIYHAEIGPSWITFLEAESLNRLAEEGEEAALIISALGVDGAEGVEREKGRGLLAYYMGDVATYMGHKYCDECGIVAPTFANPRRADYLDEHIESSCAVPL